MKWLCRVVLLAVVAGSTALAVGQNQSEGVPVHMVVTVETRHGSAMPDISQQDVMVNQGKNRLKTTEWIPLTGDRAGAQVWILIDDGLNTSLGSQLDDIRQFINEQPATTAVGVGYMRDGTVQIAQDLTNDHAKAAKSLRLPLGNPGINSSPYVALQDLMKRWPEAQERREVLMVTDGIDRLWEEDGIEDPYVDETRDQAQKAGILVFSIYSPGVGHYSHSYWRTNWAQSYLSQLSDETGGESYYILYGTPVAYVPYLNDFSQKLGRQYLLTFLAKPGKKAGLQKVKVQTEVPNVDLVAADAVWVPAGQ
jgi:hypothetical protein